MRLGFVGLGRMGLPMARRLMARGHEVIGYDTRAEPLAQLRRLGGTPAASLGEVSAPDLPVLVSLPTPDVVREVALGKDGLLGDAAPGSYIDLSTTGTRVAAEVAAGMAERGVPVLDAPVSGGVRGAANGTLAVMASGSRPVFDECRVLLEILGSNVFFVGDRPGQGQAMKLVNNMLSGAALALTSEGMALGVKAGLDPSTMLDVLNAGSGRNSATEDKFPRAVLPRTFDQGFATGLLHKDLRLCLEMAEELGVPLWLGSSVYQLWTFAMSQGGAPEDFTTIVKYFEDWAGVEIAGRGETAGGSFI